MWFQDLTGFKEQNPEQVRSNLILDGNTITSRVNGYSYTCGTLKTPSLAELRQQVKVLENAPGKLTLSEVFGDVGRLHSNPEHAGALFQVASQFNLLEMVSPGVTPEHGITGYENDHTQGPACAIACGAGTIYRNYFAPVKGQVGQSAALQIDCLEALGIGLANEDGQLWEMCNGYALASDTGLKEITQLLQDQTEAQRDELRKMLQVGIHGDTQVTRGACQHLVTQVYASALPVAYSHHPSQLWSAFARLVLEASYEAVFCAAAVNATRTKNNKLFLTLLGGGAFGNHDSWIFDAVERALNLFKAFPLDVAVVSYGRPNPKVHEMISRL